MRQWIVTCLLAVLPSIVAAQPGARPPTDLDRLMEDVVKRRDDNWKKLQQYILNERQKVTVTGPDGLRLYGSVHDYPVVREGRLLHPQPARGQRRDDCRRRAAPLRRPLPEADEGARRAQGQARGRTGHGAPAPAPAESVGDLLNQQAEPSFVSAAYFLKFKFEPGRYALAGRETIDGKEVLRIEYYPARLFDDDERCASKLGRTARTSAGPSATRHGSAGRAGVTGTRTSASSSR